MATPKKSPVKSKTPVKSPKGKSPKASPKSKTPAKTPAKSPAKTPAKSPKVAKVIAKKEPKKATKTKVVDPNKPKRAPSAYFIYLGENRAKIIADHKLDGSKVAEVAKKAGEIWGAMTDAQKKPYQDKADKAKEQYEKDVASYEPDESQFITKKGTKAAKDPTAPKKATTAYFLFMGENRAKIIADHKLDASKVAEVAKKAGEIWGAMTDAQKAPFVKKAEADKARYAQELAAHAATRGA